MRKDTKGITLVTLVVTVIAFVVIAGVTLSLIIGQNGLFARTSQSAQQHKIEAIKEKIRLHLAWSGEDTLYGKLNTIEGIESIDSEEVGASQYSIVIDGYEFLIDAENGKAATIEYIGEANGIYPVISNMTQETVSDD